MPPVEGRLKEEDKETVLDSGADDFIAKLIQESELWDKIGQCLNVGLLFDEQERPAADRPETLPLTKESLVELPQKLVVDMRAAVQGGYMGRLAELARSAGDNHPGLSQQLLELVDRYDYETISRLFLERKQGAGKSDH